MEKKVTLQDELVCAGRKGPSKNRGDTQQHHRFPIKKGETG